MTFQISKLLNIFLLAYNQLGYLKQSWRTEEALLLLRLLLELVWDTYKEYNDNNKNNINNQTFL